MKRDVGLHRLWKDAVIALRGTTCESCGEGEATTVIEAHHLAPFKEYPALGYRVENGVVLCCRCHAHLHSGRSELISRVNEALIAADPGRIDWIHDHIEDACPDYNDSRVVAAIRESLHARIPAELETCYKRYYRENKEAVNARNRNYVAAHQAELKEYRRKYYLAHKDEINAKTKAYYEKNKEAVLAQCRVYHARKKAKKKEWADNYQRKHAEELAAKRRAWKEANPEKVRAWFDSHRAYLAEKERERRRWKKIVKQTEALPMEEPT